MSDHDEHVHCIPTGEGQPEHRSHANCWCEPELVEDYTDENGLKLYVHKEMH